MRTLTFNKPTAMDRQISKDVRHFDLRYQKSRVSEAYFSKVRTGTCKQPTYLWLVNRSVLKLEHRALLVQRCDKRTFLHYITGAQHVCGLQQ